MATLQAIAASERWLVRGRYDHSTTWTFTDELGQPQTVTTSNGLSATVFEDTQTHQRYLAIRGTDDVQDLITDAIDIGFLGTSLFQAQYQSLAQKVAEWQADGTLTPTFTVTGHSLGGYLAASLLYDQPLVVEHAYLFNAPGQGGVVASTLNALLQAATGQDRQLSLDLTRVTNVRAADGLSPIAGLGLAWGSPVLVGVEDQHSPDVDQPAAARNHSQRVLADALAVYDLFARVDDSITPAAMRDLLGASSGRVSTTLEEAVTSLSSVFLTDRRSVGRESRDELYAAIDAVSAAVDAGHARGETYSLQALDPDAASLRNLARSDLAVRVALAELNPFVVRGINYDGRAQELSVQDPATGQGELTDSWLADRSAMLARQEIVNRNDGYDSSLSTGPATAFADLTLNRVVFSKAPGAAPFRHVVFGSEANDSALAGDALDDRLYGMAGNDAIDGLGGADTIEGGSGADQLAGGDGVDRLRGGGDADTLDGGAGGDLLYGDAGTDTLHGGAGEDWLDGGRDRDRLEGGADFDHYTVRNDGQPDEVVDADGRGELIFADAGGRTVSLRGLAIADRGVANTWRLVDGAGSVYVMTRNSPLTITAPDGTQVVLPEFASGDLGVTLLNAAVDEATTNTVVGDTQSGKKDVLAGSAANDLIQSGLDDDTVAAGAGADRVQGGAGRDILRGQDGADVVEGGSGADNLFGDAGDDRLYADAAAALDPLTVVTQAIAAGHVAGVATQGDWLDGGAGADVLVGATTADVLNGGGGSDVIVGGGGADTLLGDVGFAPVGLNWSTTETIAGGARTRNFFGMNGGPTDAPDGSGDMLYGGGGNDFAMAGAGDDAVYGDEGDDFLQGEGGSDTLSGGDGVDELLGDGTPAATQPHGSDTLDGGAGNDKLTGGGGADRLDGGAGDDVIIGDDAVASVALAEHGADVIDGGTGADNIDGNGGDDRIVGGADGDTLRGSEGDDDLDGGTGDDWLNGGADEDTMRGGAGADELQGGEGADALDGGADADRLWGEAGDDTIAGDDGDDYLDGGDGVDQLDAGQGNDVLVGAAGDDALAGGDGDDQLVGGGGADRIDGGAGGDRLWGQDDADDLAGGGADDLLMGGDGDDRLDGGAGDDGLWGDQGDDTLAGGGGRDLLAGGAGNDRYLVDGAAGEVQIADDGGANTVSFGAGIAAGDLRLRVGVDAAGNANHLVLELGADQRVTLLDALAGGAAGFDFAFADGETLSLAELRALHDADPPAAAMQVEAATGLRGHHGTAGDDHLVAATGAEQQYGYAGNDTLTGGAGADTLDGGSGNDTLDGRGGDDLLKGGPGQDLYVFSRTSGRDSIEERVTAPTPVSETDVVALAAGIAPADVTLHRDGVDLVVAVGQTQAQLRVKGHFNTTEPTLNPATGQTETWFADRRIEAIRFADSTVWDATAIAARTVAGTPNAMSGTTANDTFTVDDAGDSVTEAVGGGSDVVRSSVSYALRPNVERLTLTGFVDLAAWANAGNAVSYLDGNAGNNTFNGPGTYVNASGTPVTSVGGGEAGYAVMAGGAGDDTYWLRTNVGGQVVEAAAAGNDTVVLSGGDWITYTLPANVEQLRSAEGGSSYAAQTRYRTGNALDNTIEGFRPYWLGAGPHNVIDGGAGADTMIGFDGNDVYIVDNAGDRVVDRGADTASGWHAPADEVRSSVSYVLPEHVEILTLTGATAIDGTGNDLANTLDGAANAAANTLRGGRGDDRYRVGAADLVVEHAGEGIDTIEIAGTGTRTYRPDDLPANVEGLAFGDDLGAADYEGDLRDDRVTGNGSANRLDGGSGDDRLAGGAGNDVLVGGTGDDLLDGGAGLDEVHLSRGFGQDQVVDSDRLYRVVFDATIAAGDVALRDGWLSVAGGSDRVHLAEGAELRFADGTVVSRAEFNAMLRASRSSAPTSGADLLTGTEAADTLDALEDDDFVYGKGGDDTITGGAGDDRLFGDDGADAIGGGTGRDQLRGGAGDDALDGGDDGDVLHGDDGADRLAGGAATDYLHGDAGDDDLDGGTDGDQLDGGAGADRLVGGDGDFDYLDGGDGDDQLFGDRIEGVGAGDGVDYLTGGAGNDTLTGGGGSDSLDGGAGNDTYVLQAGGGIDVVTDAAVEGETTVVLVDDGIAAADLGLARVVDEWGWATLQLRANGDADGLDLSEFGDAAHPLEIRFADGTVWTQAAIQERLYTRHGTDGADLLEGGEATTGCWATPVPTASTGTRATTSSMAAPAPTPCRAGRATIPTSSTRPPTSSPS